MDDWSTIRVAPRDGFSYSGNKIEGVYKTDRQDLLVIQREKLLEYLRNTERKESLEQSQTTMMKIVMESAAAGTAGKNLKELESEIERLRGYRCAARSRGDGTPPQDQRTGVCGGRPVMEEYGGSGDGR